MDRHPGRQSAWRLTVMALLLLLIVAVIAAGLLARAPRRLVQQLGVQGGTVRNTAYHQLRTRNDWFTTRALLQGLRSPTPTIRQHCALLIGQKKIARAFIPLSTLLKDREPFVRAAAVRAVEQLHQPGTLDALLPMIQDPDVSVRDAAFIALRGERDPRFIKAVVALLDRLGGNEDAIAYKADALIRRIGSQAVTPLLAALPTADGRERRQIISLLGTLRDPRAVPALAAIARDRQAKDRGQAIFGLAYIGGPGIDVLSGLLKNGDREARIQIVPALGFTADPRGVSLLLNAAGSPDLPVRRSAFRALRKVADSRRVAAFYAALHDRDAEIRGSGIIGLKGEMTSRARDAVIPLCDDPDGAVRAAAVGRLAEFADGKALDTLRRLSSRPDCPFPALARLANTRDPSIITALIRRLQPPADDEAADIRPWMDNPAEALAFFGEQALPALTAALRNTDPAIRAGTAHALGMSGCPRAREPLIAVLRDGDPRVRRSAAIGLEMLGDARAIPALIGMLRDANLPVRLAVVRALGATHDPRVITPLLPLLNDPFPAMRAATVRALAPFNDAAVMAAMEEVQNDLEVEVRYALAEGGTWARNPRGTQLLAKMLSDRNKRTRESVAATLDLMDDPAEVPYLLPQLDSPLPDVRKTVLTVLGKLQDRQAVDALIDALTDDEPSIRTLAAQHLDNILTPDALPRLEELINGEDYAARILATRCCGAAGSAALRVLAPLAEDVDPQVRDAAARALGLVKDDRAADLLIRLVNDPELDVRIDAMGALAVLKSKKATPALLPYVKNGDGHELYTAVFALGEIRDPTAIPALVGRLRDLPSRYPLVVALGKLDDPRALSALDGVLASGMLPLERMEMFEEVGELSSAQATGLIFKYHAKFPNDPDLALAMSEMNDPRIAEPLLAYLELHQNREVPKLLGEIMQALARVKDRRAIPQLLQALRGFDAETAGAAATALGEFADPQTADALLAAMARGTLGRGYQDARLRQAAARSLGRMKADSVRAKLKIAARSANWRVRAGAVQAMGAMQESWALSILQSALSDPQPHVRAAAMDVLSAIGNTLSQNG